MKFKIILTIVCVLNTVFLSAQQAKTDSVVNRSVMVERDFQPVIQDAGKIITPPKESEPQVDILTPEYSDFALPLKISYDIKSLDPEILVHQKNDTKSGYFRFGIGYPANTLADFMYPVLKTENNRLDFALHHLGAFGEKTHSATSATLQYDHLFDNFSIFAGLKGSHDYFNYYGKWFGVQKPFIMSAAAASSDYNSKDVMYNNSFDNSVISLYDLSGLPLNETHWRVGGHIGVKSLPQSDGIKYLFDLQYNIFQSVRENTNENDIALKGLFEVPFGDNFLGMNIDMHNMGYSVYNIDKFNFPKTYSVVKINPYYKASSEVGFLKLGLKIGISPNYGQIFTPSPDVQAQWNAIKEYLAIYGGVTGDLQINSMSDMYDKNRYLSSPLRLNDLYTPIDAYAGIKFKPAYNFLFDVFGNYKIITKQYFFVNRKYGLSQHVIGLPSNLDSIYQNRFDVLYANATKSTIGLRADYNYQNRVNVYLKGAYNFWDVDGQQYAWQMPVWDIDFGASAKIMDNINVSTQVFFQDGRYAKIGNNAVAMTPTLDINLSGSYSYNDWMSFFVKFNNLLNRHYDTYYGYEVQGINAMAGVILSF